MSQLTLTPEELNFLTTLGLDVNSANLNVQIQGLINSQNSSQIMSSKPSNLSQILTKIYTEIIPELQKSGQTWDIDYSFERSENKRYESLKKRGCTEIKKVGL